jgi:hypothetical protein
MQQRRVRLGDILDDYCPRERRVTNHAVVAMIDDEVKQTRCTTCDADHEYKHGKVPPQRRKRADGTLVPAAGVGHAEPQEEPQDAAMDEVPSPEAGEPIEPAPAVETVENESEPVAAAGADEDGPVHRRLIRATLPRPNGQAPERREPEFTIRQPGFGRGRGFDQKNGQRHGHRPLRGQGGQGGSNYGFPRQGSGQGSGQGQGQGSGGPGFRQGGGNRSGHPGGPRGPRHGGAGRGGRKRGR